MKEPLKSVLPASILLAFLLPCSSADRPESPVTRLRINGERLAQQIEKLLAAIECVQVIRERGVSTRYPLEIVIFSDEEGGSIGSLAMAGELPAVAMETISQSGKTIREGISRQSSDSIGAALRKINERE